MGIEGAWLGVGGPGREWSRDPEAAGSAQVPQPSTLTTPHAQLRPALHCPPIPGSSASFRNKGRQGQAMMEHSRTMRYQLCSSPRDVLSDQEPEEGLVGPWRWLADLRGGPSSLGHDCWESGYLHLAALECLPAAAPAHVQADQSFVHTHVSGQLSSP